MPPTPGNGSRHCSKPFVTPRRAFVTACALQTVEHPVAGGVRCRTAPSRQRTLGTARSISFQLPVPSFQLPVPSFQLPVPSFQLPALKISRGVPPLIDRPGRSGISGQLSAVSSQPSALSSQRSSSRPQRVDCYGSGALEGASNRAARGRRRSRRGTRKSCERFYRAMVE
jgi:hypothetical protein